MAVDHKLDDFWAILERPEVALSGLIPVLCDQLLKPGTLTTLAASDTERAQLLSTVGERLNKGSNQEPTTCAFLQEPASTYYLVRKNAWETLALAVREVGDLVSENYSGERPQNVLSLAWAIVQAAKQLPNTRLPERYLTLAAVCADPAQLASKLSLFAKGQPIPEVGLSAATTSSERIGRLLQFLEVSTRVGITAHTCLAFDALDRLLVSSTVCVENMPLIVELHGLLEDINLAPASGVSAVIGWTGCNVFRQTLLRHYPPLYTLLSRYILLEGTP